MKRVLFICGRNRWRSPTAKQVFSAWPNLAVCSAGLARDADNPVTPEPLRWAELIFVMEPSHRKKLSAKFRAHLHARRVICLNIPDDHEFMDPRLVELLTARVAGFLPRLRAKPRRRWSESPAVRWPEREHRAPRPWAELDAPNGVAEFRERIVIAGLLWRIALYFVVNMILCY